MDFWLSFMAVVSTFVYLAAIDEVSKRTIHTVVAILTALMAETGATRYSFMLQINEGWWLACNCAKLRRSSNIILVIAIGAVGLLVGWLIELVTHFRTLSFSAEFSLNILQRWVTISYLNNECRFMFRILFSWARDTISMCNKSLVWIDICIIAVLVRRCLEIF